jgi:hypothetical protein
VNQWDDIAMNTGSGLSGGGSGGGARPPESGADAAAGGGDDGTFADILNGFSLDSGRGRRKRKKSKKSQDEDHAAADAAGFSSASPPTDQGDRVTSVVSPPANTDGLASVAGGLFDASHPIAEYVVPVDYPPLDDQAHPPDETAIVRPYALTGGRTRSNYALELETLVSTREDVADGAISEAAVQPIESLSIMEQCQSPRSVAEIAAVLRVPLGVARVLISDAADAGLVTVHKTISGKDGAEAHLVLMERVLSGLRRL